MPDLPAEFEGFTIAQLTDLHAGPFLGRGGLRSVVESVNRREVDLVALTGDFVTHHWSEAEFIADDLAKLESREGSFAVFGNHDYKDRMEERIESAYPAVRFLRNSGVRIERGVHSLALLGLEDLEEGKVIDLKAAQASAGRTDVALAMCHNPHGGTFLAEAGMRVVLSGHTHGTQVDLPFLRRLGPPHPGLRVELGETTLIVSRGLGVVGIPWRFRSPAEVVYVILERDHAR